MSDDAYLVEEIAIIKKKISIIADLLSEIAQYGVLCPQSEEELKKLRGE